MESDRWYSDHRVWLELFVFANLSGLIPDIALAHATNGFRHPGEAVPLAFCLVASPACLAALVAWRVRGRERAWRAAGFAIGWFAIATGIAGLIWHLSSRFLAEMTLDSLVYTAPFAAPLAYVGLGLLLIANRMVDHRTRDWPLWVLVIAEGGFVGNFVFSLADHAQNGFFHFTEWIPVAASAFAVAFLAMPLMRPVGRPYLWLCGGVLGVQVVVGLLGFAYHVRANLAGPSQSLLDNFIYGAPAMAPLLLPNLVLLAALALVVLGSAAAA